MINNCETHACAGGRLLAGFVELLFRRLLLEDLGNDTAELAADALLPLILAHSDAFRSFGKAPPCCASVSCACCLDLQLML